MRSRFLILFFFLGWVSPGFADEAVIQNGPPISIFIARTAEQFQAPHVFTYHMLEYEEMHGKWIIPDIGAYDDGHGNYHEFFAGLGAQFYTGKNLALTEEPYFAQDTGAAGHRARYLWLWTQADLQFARKLTGTVVVYPSFPLDHGAHVEYVVDRAKAEYAFWKHVALGGGYAGDKSPGSDWSNKPFVESKVTTREGIFEFWAQKTDGGGQLQMRYMLIRPKHR